MALQLWRDVALILLILELMILVLPFLFLSFYALKGVRSLNRSVRGFLFKVGRGMSTVQVVADKAAGGVAAPVIVVYSCAAFGRGLIRGALSVARGRTG